MIRKASKDDISRIQEIQVSAWRAGYTHFIPLEFFDSLNTEARLQQYESLFDDRKQQFYLYDIDRVSTGVAHFYYDEEKSNCFFEHLYVDPEYWAKGIGGTLLSYAIEKSEKAGLATISLWASQKNTRATDFYKRRGFEYVPGSDCIEGLSEDGGVNKNARGISDPPDLNPEIGEQVEIQFIKKLGN